ncbi:MAG: gliding motility-associated C-terminal domain-containing protein [Elusimicrobia bacterium]|nr:gliding motility-associated C-terminal domain-containing protein [Elusimicrobiota bacterium]
MKNKSLLLLFVSFAAFFDFAAADSSLAVTRLVTPNNDKKNDTFIFRCYNPKEAQVNGKIYDLKGTEIAAMRLKPLDYATYYYDLEWDPNSGPEKAPGGIYVYQVTVEDRIYKGAVVVIR